MKRPFVIALVGLVGSGKSSVGKEIAKRTHATYIEADAIRLELRKKRKGGNNIRELVESRVNEALAKGESVIIDSDFVTAEKRRPLIQLTKKKRITLQFVQIFADPEVIIGRMLSARYSTHDLFGGASTTWRGPTTQKGAVIKIREFWRRTPLHFSWNEEGGGQWHRKKLPFVTQTIDTTDGVSWKRQTASLAKKLNGGR